ncbi:MAG: glycosyltransferase family 39 protein [Planctomycetes bacterium]|nr:glycosyltransferase family 39 protein [Planctomycetota bacterium]
MIPESRSNVNVNFIVTRAQFQGGNAVIGSPTDTAGESANQAGKIAHLLLIGSICLVLYLAGNGQISLWDRDEPRYAQAAREMLQSGNFIVPTFNAEPRFHKPVLIYWLMAMGYSLFGDNEFGARFCSAVAGTITCLLTYRLGTRLGGRAVGLAAGLMLAVSPLMIVESKLATTDAVLTATLLGAMSCVWDLHVEGFSWSRSLGLWTLLGIAVLTKGPIGLGTIATALLTWFLLSRQAAVLRRMNWAAGLAVFAAVVLPWGIAVYRATGGEFYREAISGHVLAHALTPMEHHGGFPGYYLVMAMTGLFPWSLGLPLAVRGVRQWARQDGAGSFLLGWMIGPLLLLELMRTKLPHYYLPAFPAWAVLFARGLVGSYALGERLAGSRRGLLRVAGLATVCVVAACSLATLAVGWGPRELLGPAILVAVLLGVGTIVAAVLFLRARDFAGWATLVSTWGALGLVTFGWLAPRAEVCRVARVAAQELRARATEGMPAVLHNFREPSLVFYLGGPVPIVPSTTELVRLVREHGPVLTLLQAEEPTKLQNQPAIHVEICQRIEPRKIGPRPAKAIVVARLSRSRIRE